LITSPGQFATIDIDGLVTRMAGKWRRVLLFGERGAGKSTLAAELGRRLGAQNVALRCIGADPGTPAFGPPGAVALARWTRLGWQTDRIEPLCTLDAGRFRLPLVQAAARLVDDACPALVIDAPGVVRGVAGQELLAGLVEACRVDAVVLLEGDDAIGDPVRATLASLAVPVVRMAAAPAARRPDALARARARTEAWDRYLAGPVEVDLPLEALRLLGTPPPEALPDAWRGRQVALCRGPRLMCLAEAQRLHEGRLLLRCAADPAGADTLLVRDVVRRADGLLATAPPSLPASTPAVVEECHRETRRPLLFDAGAFAVTVLNGVCGDPVVVLRPRGARRVLLLDLGEATALSRRVMHRVTDVFVTHAHFDHVAGFQWLLRARMGSVVLPCRVYGPPGMHGHVTGMIAAVCWDRIGDAGPEFEVGEVHADRIEWVRIKAGTETRRMGSQPRVNGVLLDEPGLRVSAIELDHGIPVLSFAVESGGERRTRKERLAAVGLPAGPWLGLLKRHLAQGETDAVVQLPDGRAAGVAGLAERLVVEQPRIRLVYATDFADTPANRTRLIAHARGADALICEATFVTADADQAARTQHLTARACGEIAAAAGVGRLVPIHFSKRYESRPEAVYAEIRAACANVALQGLARS
jgi:ribonuclease BN (tRNA processing enzyme)